MAKTLLAFLCIVMTVGPVQSSVTRFWADKQVLRPGESIFLTCQFSNFDAHAITHFRKIFPDNRTVDLTTNYELVESLLGSKRFNFTYKDPAFAGDVVTQTLWIMNAVPGDSGNYSCYMLDNQLNRSISNASVNITVQAEPTTIKLYLNDTEVYNGTNSAPLPFLRAPRLRCETTGSNPGANITITAGQGKQVHLSSVIVGNATALDDRYPIDDFTTPVFRTTTALADHWVFDTDSVGNPVVCWAKVDRDAPGIMASFIPVVADGPPQIECNDTFYAFNGQRNFVINCSSFAKPSITKAMFFYVKDKMNNTIQGFPFNEEHFSPDGKFRAIVQTFGDIKTSLRLTIDSVNTSANIAFNFYVDNGLGQDIHQVTIKEKGMISSSAALSTCLVTFLFIWLLGFGIRGQL